jgi:hypothetical protein
MKRLLELLSFTCVAVFIGSLVWSHRSSVPIPAVALPSAATPAADNHVEYAEEVQAREMVTITGPLADYMTRRRPVTTEPAGQLQHVTRPMTSSDHAGDSPVGTSNSILHKTFFVAKAANLSFELPAHASNPQLRGTYSSFVQQANSSDSADVEFLLLDERQYSDFLNRRPSDALFSAEGSQDQEVKVSMPPTLDRPAKYYLVFRNGSPGTGKVAVQADFRVDF